MIEEALAADRLTRLLMEDEISRPAREAFQRWALDGGHGTLLYLSTCPWCLSLWAAGAILLLPKKVRRALAVAGAVSIAYEVRERLKA